MADVRLRIPEPVTRLLSKPKRVKIAVGGRGSGKSVGVGDIMLMLADQGERILCTREFQNSIDDSVHESLKDEISRLGVEGFSVSTTDVKTSTGGRIFYKGLARNITSLKSIAGINRLWIEEGESVSEQSLKVLTPSVRSKADNDGGGPPEIWITMNRRSSQDAVAKKYLSRAEDELKRCGYYEDELIMVVEVNWRDNPWFPSELEQERQDDLINLSRAEYDHIWEGHYNDTVPNSIIKPEWFDAAIDAHKKLGFTPTGLELVTHDPSDLGPDPKGLCYRHGSVIMDVQEKSNGDFNEGFHWALQYAIDHQVDGFVWDGDGMGVGGRQPTSEALQGKKIEAVMFRGSESPEHPDAIYEAVRNTKKDIKGRPNKEVFRNKRAQFYTRLADRFYNTYRAIEKGVYINPDDLISLSSDIECLKKLRAELCSIPLKPGGKIQILSKEEMKKKPYNLPSPNLADSVMMSEMTVSVTEEFEEIVFDSLW
jgi:phage terminase, large subunit, PBSX family